MALGSLGLASTLVLSSLVGGRAEMTEASWTDTERVTAEIEAAWPEAFVSVVAGSARSAETMINSSSNMTYQSQFRWTSQLTKSAVTPANESTTGWADRNRIWDQRYQGTGVAVNDWAPSPTPNPLGDLDPSTLALHDGNAVRAFTNPGTRTRPQNYRCLIINDSFRGASNRPECDLGNGFAAAKNTTDAAGFSIGTGLTQFTYLNAAHLTTAVRCGIDSATADSPTGRIDFGQESSLGGQGQQNLDYGGLLISRNPRTVWSGGFGDLGNAEFPPPNNTISDMWSVQDILGVSTHAKVMPVITQYASPAGTQPYAVSEVAAYIEVYRRAVAGASIDLHAKMYFVLSRSECGVKRVGDSTLPEQRSIFPSELPGGNGLTPYDGTGFTPAAQQSHSSALRGLQESESLTSTLASATTITSPSEHTTASETTTSAPPNPDDSNTPTSSPRPTRVTTTSASPTSTAPTPQPTIPAATAKPRIVVPHEPGALSPTARLEDVETITVREENLVVVIEGDTVPTDARQGAVALEIWLSGGDPGTTWATFASDDPDEDGWRWAAINLKTGTVVYIR